MPQNSNDLIVGAVGVLQFEVVAYRLKEEYKVDCVYEPVVLILCAGCHVMTTKTSTNLRKKHMTNYRLMVVVT